MIRTITLLECDGCGEAIIGCQDGTSNREFNALREGRRQEWVRVHEGGDLKDFCPKCRLSNAR